MAITPDAMKLFGDSMTVMGFLAEKADEKEYLKRAQVELPCVVLKDSVARVYKSGPKTGDLRGHLTNLATSTGDIFQDILVDYAVSKDEEVIVTVTLLIPDSFLEGKIKIKESGEAAKPKEPLKIPSPNPPKNTVPGAMDMAGKP